PSTTRITPVHLRKKLRQVWDMMEIALNRAILLQSEGKVFDHPFTIPPSVKALFNVVNEISAQDKGRLAVHEREMVNFARKFATLLNGMTGIRLRRLTQKDTTTIQEKATPQIGENSGIEEEPMAEKEETKVKEEPEDEEEGKPLPLFRNDIGAEVEVKQEEIEEEEVTFDDLRVPALKKEEKGQKGVEGAVQMARKRVAPVSVGRAKRRSLGVHLPSSTPSPYRSSSS
ncbi:hypothetical protein PMAYCL1PPCAC_21913, partial [Pristionchus mayeri]